MRAGNNYPTRELVRETLEKPELRLVPHIGYVSLFPFMEKIIPPVSCMEDLIMKIMFYSLCFFFLFLNFCNMVVATLIQFPFVYLSSYCRPFMYLNSHSGVMDPRKTA